MVGEIFRRGQNRSVYRKETDLPADMPDNHTIHRLAAVPKAGSHAYSQPISGGHGSPRRKAKRPRGTLEARTARRKAGLPAGRWSRDLRGRLKRANADGGPMRAMKAGKVLRWRTAQGPQGFGRCGPGTGAASGRRLAGAVKIKAGMARRPSDVAAATDPDLTGRRWEKSRRRLSFGACLRRSGFVSLCEKPRR
jgi:hypothetical protein